MSLNESKTFPIVKNVAHIGSECVEVLLDCDIQIN